MQIKKFPKVAVVATKLNFLQYTYRFGINHKTLYSQTFPGPHFGSWTTETMPFTSQRAMRPKEISPAILNYTDQVCVGP